MVTMKEMSSLTACESPLSYVGFSALYQHCTLKDDISYLLPT